MKVLWLIVMGWASVTTPSPRGQCMMAPVQAPVVVVFRAPSCAYCSGQRGIEYAVGFKTPVLAAATGDVTFSGVVAGTRYVVVRQGGGLLATYGMLDDTPLHRGDSVQTGQVIGWATNRLYFGLRRDGEYVDPVPLLSSVTRRHRLVPTDGSVPRSARLLGSTCASRAGTTLLSR